MMLLGIYLHVVVGYSGDGHWPYIDRQPTHALNFTLGIIHAFRMPAFFVMAGFFGALLWTRRGPRSFVINRFKRIIIPFALFWAILFPLMGAIVLSIRTMPNQTMKTLESGSVSHHLHPLHLWFLEYLILLYAIGAVVAYASSRAPEAWKRGFTSAYRWALNRPYAPALFAVFSWVPLTLMRGNLKDCDGFTPEPLILSAYIGPFLFGWVLYHNRDLLPRFERHTGVYVALAVVAFFVYGLASAGTQPALKAAGNVLLCWLLIFACTGLFLKYFSRSSPLGRYMSDASYWLYIVHMPVVVGFQVALMRLPIPALAKIPLVLALSVVVLVVSYDLFVRPTWIGALLNGRRYPRRLPKVSESLAQPAAA
jgi:peptidoglycan/LPS O-acetylase OafA/YrhL